MCGDGGSKVVIIFVSFAHFVSYRSTIWFTAWTRFGRAPWDLGKVGGAGLAGRVHPVRPTPFTYRAFGNRIFLASQSSAPGGQKNCFTEIVQSTKQSNPSFPGKQFFSVVNWAGREKLFGD